MTLCFRVEVQSVRASERAPADFSGTPEDARFEEFCAGPLKRALAQVDFPWWVYSELEIKPTKRRGMKVVPVPEGLAGAGAGAGGGGGGGGDLDTPDGGACRRRTRQSP